jgi:L-fucose mutarotase
VTVPRIKASVIAGGIFAFIPRNRSTIMALIICRGLFNRRPFARVHLLFFRGRVPQAQPRFYNEYRRGRLHRWDPTVSRQKELSIQGRRSMLKSIDPILNADVLYALQAMGHGDDLVICDTNFPADAIARQTVLGRLLRIDNVTAGRAARAILSVLPLDSFVDKPALRMEIVGKPDEVPPVQIEVQREIDAAEGSPLSMGSIERMAFYELAKKSYCVIQTGERRFYGCFVFKKGVIGPDAA